jgi:hypothetical protein
MTWETASWLAPAVGLTALCSFACFWLYFWLELREEDGGKWWEEWFEWGPRPFNSPNPSGLPLPIEEPKPVEVKRPVGMLPGGR